MSIDRYEDRKLFRKKFNLECEIKYSRLSKLWMIYGNNGIKHTSAGHYFIQEVIEHNFVDWKSWSKKLHPELVDIIKKDYPELVANCKEFAQSRYVNN
jgi:hypothetical protein